VVVAVVYQLVALSSDALDQVRVAFRPAAGNSERRTDLVGGKGVEDLRGVTGV
jgi:hypothetical protein